MTTTGPGREVLVAPNIYRAIGQGTADQPLGRWRVYVRRDGRKRTKRFPKDYTLGHVQTWIDGYNQETQDLRAARGLSDAEYARTFPADVDTYLALKQVKAMPSFRSREIQLTKCATRFRRRCRPDITTKDLNELLQGFIDRGYSGSYVNKIRNALMSLWTRLDGRSAPNPVKDTKLYPEAPIEARGASYDILRKILAAVPDRSRPIKGVKGSRDRGSVSKARLEVLVWTGMDPAELRRMGPENVNLAERWYTVPHRRKGTPTRFPEPLVRKPMTDESQAAFERWVAFNDWGVAFSTDALRHTWQRAVTKVERNLRKTRRDTRLSLARIRRLKDIRHSFGTELSIQTEGNLGLVGEMLGHRDKRTTRRYQIGAVPVVLAAAMAKFETATKKTRKTRGRGTNAQKGYRYPPHVSPRHRPT
jgi:integrase